MTLKERVNILFNKIDHYIEDTPNRKQRKFEKRMEGDEKKLEALQLKAEIEREKSNIEQERILREAARLKLREIKEKSRPKNSSSMPMPLFMAKEQERKKVNHFSNVKF